MDRLTLSAGASHCTHRRFRSTLREDWAAMPASMTGDTVGAFRFICSPGQVPADDPIVYPRQPGKSHLHQFYGNTSANAYSTHDSLIARQEHMHRSGSPAETLRLLDACAAGRQGDCRPTGLGPGVLQTRTSKRSVLQRSAKISRLCRNPERY